jgi:hypothetical protein
MTTSIPPAQLADPAPSDTIAAPTGGAGPVILFTATTFLSALLLFSIQPMFAKMVLPVLGGSPSVWAVAMCFFQAALLAGYCYAHVLIRWLPGRAAVVHLGFGLLALLALPIGLPPSWGDPPAGDPYLWQLGLFAVGVGLPFAAVAANAPLLQAWFAGIGHRDSSNPYFLYAASNLGSLIALLGYPFLLEPLLGLRSLAAWWTAGFIGLQAAIAACAWYSGLLTLRARIAAHDAGPTAIDHRPTAIQRAKWVGLALVPSALLTAFTTHVATDVASAPLIWVIPLSLYLLTFVLVFRDRALVPPRLLLLLHLAAVVFALLQLSQTRHEGWFLSAFAGLAAFFTTAMVAHRTLYDQRPAARYLTEFYLWMSVGGGLGGLFAGLIAPQIFSEVFEYPILLALGMACRPGALDIRGRDGEWRRLWLIVAAGILALYWIPWAIVRLPTDTEASGFVRILTEIHATLDRWGQAAVLTAAFAAALPFFWRHPPRQLVVGLLMGTAVVMLPSSVRQGEAQRSFFGVYRVSGSYDSEFNILKHGTTLHGAQRVRDAEGSIVVDTTPATYYYPQSPMAQSIEFVRAALEARGAKGRYGVIGLGTGSLACYAKEEESWRFFEIDPVIVGIASNPENFSFLHYCQPNPDIVIGDARLTMAKQPDGSFDLIIVDAFSSDAVPVHLMTAEALRMYARKLTPTGIVLLHISNRYLDLDSVLSATLPLVPGIDGLLMSDDNADGSYAASTSTVAVFSNSSQALEVFRATAEAKEFEATTVKPWTDDTSDILGPFLSKLK